MDRFDQGDLAADALVPSESPVDFASRVNLPFSNFMLLSRSLTHRSYLNERPEALEDNERLEFLGDAVLDFLVGAWLYQHFPEMSEGDLTRMRSALVRTEQLADFARRIDLGAAMRLGRGEGLGGGRQREALLCGAFEALVGALYLDAGIQAVQEFIEPILEPAADQILQMRKDQDPKSLLQEWVQSQGFGPPQYRTVGAYGPEHEKTFEVEVIVNEGKGGPLVPQGGQRTPEHRGQVYGRGVGHSKQAAAKAAARAALITLGVD
jgi:ribonuclease-3